MHSTLPPPAQLSAAVMSGAGPSLPCAQAAPRSESPTSPSTVGVGYHHDEGREFCRFIRQELQTGIDGNKEPASYVPRAALEHYWTRRRIQNVLHSTQPAVHEQHAVIQQSCLQLFSILVYVNAVHELPTFMNKQLHDRSFPTDRMPEALRDSSPVIEEVWHKFSQQQWLFFPLYFDRDILNDIDVPARCVLPFKEQPLRKNCRTLVRTVEIHASCNKLVGRDKKPVASGLFVLKTYNQRAEDEYRRERAALTALENRSSEYIVAFHGSFRQNKTLNLVLEYVDGGHIYEFFQATERPSCWEDVVNFWTSLFNIFKGLDAIHAESPSGQCNGELVTKCIHQDLKPENVVLAKVPGVSKFLFTPKIIDFGHADLRAELSSDSTGTGLNQYGCPRYSAPECSRPTDHFWKTQGQTTRKADIWSAGSILSEATVWMGSGYEGVRRYFKRRQSETRGHETLQGSNMEACFHNGVSPLDAIDQAHLEARAEWLPVDKLTPRISKLILEDMLLADPVKREDASMIIKKFDQILAESNAEVAAQCAPIQYERPPVTPPTRPFSEISIFSKAESQQTPLTSYPSPIETINRNSFGASPYSPFPQTSTIDNCPSFDIRISRDDGTPSPKIDTPDGSSTSDSPSPARKSFGDLASLRSSYGPRGSSLEVINSDDSTDPRPLSIQTPQAHFLGKLALDTGMSAGSSASFVARPSLNIPSPQTQEAGEEEGGSMLTAESSTGLRRRSCSSSNDRLNVDQVLSYREARKAKRLVNYDVDKAIKKLRGNLEGIDQFFFIDDSDSMKNHKKDLVRTFTAVAEIAKGIDPDRLEMSFASKPTNIIKNTDTTPLIKAVEDCSFDEQIASLMEHKMSNLLSGVIAKKWRKSKWRKVTGKTERDSRRIRLWVFTDGVWGEDENTDGVEQSIKEFVEFLQKSNLGRRNISIQFVQFGNDEGGRRRLQYLDDFKPYGWDIVDSKHHKGNLWPMFLGSWSSYADQMGDND